MTITLEGKINERAKEVQLPYHEIYINTRKVDREASINVHLHGTDFGWGFNGAGPTQAALAICLELIENFTDYPEYHRVYQKFKRTFLIQRIVEKDFRLDIDLDKFLADFPGLKVKSAWKF